MLFTIAWNLFFKSLELFLTFSDFFSCPSKRKAKMIKKIRVTSNCCSEAARACLLSMVSNSSYGLDVVFLSTFELVSVGGVGRFLLLFFIRNYFYQLYFLWWQSSKSAWLTTSFHDSWLYILCCQKSCSPYVIVCPKSCFVHPMQRLLRTEPLVLLSLKPWFKYCRMKIVLKFELSGVNNSSNGLSISSCYLLCRRKT